MSQLIHLSGPLWVNSTSTSGGNIVTSATQPKDPRNGDLWWRTSDESMQVYYHNGSSGVWLPAGNGVQGYSGYSGAVGKTIIASETSPNNPISGDLWWRTIDGLMLVYYDDGNSSQWVGVVGSQGVSGLSGYSGISPTIHDIPQDGATAVAISSNWAADVAPLISNAIPVSALGVTVQNYDADLAAIAGLSTTGLIERTGNGTAGITTITAAGKAILDDANAAAQRVTLDLGNVSNLAQKPRHGFPNRTATTLAFDNSTHVVTLGVATTAQIYINGVPYTISSPGLSLDLDTKTLAIGLWYVWVEISGGVPVLNASQAPWSITNLNAIPTVMIYWNGTAGAIMDERHSDGRNLELHTYLHLTVGARIQNDGSFAQVRPTTTNDGHLELTSGVLWDEDIANSISTAQGKLVRHWYETASGVWTFADGTDNAGYDRPYLWNGSTALLYPRTDSTYTLSNVANNKYLPVWVYVSNDITRPIYVVTKSYTLAQLNNYSSVTAARADLAPVLPFVPELKLLYRFIYRGDGEYQEVADYRTASSLPSGGVTTPTAASVTFTPSTAIVASNVQSALDEIVSNYKEAISYQEATGDITINWTNASVQYIYVNPAGVSIQITLPADPGPISKTGILFIKNNTNKDHTFNTSSPAVRFVDQVNPSVSPTPAADGYYTRYSCQWMDNNGGTGAWWVTVTGRDAA